MYFRYLVIISPWRRAGRSFEQTWIPFTQGCFVPSLVEIGPVVLKKKMKMWKVYRRTDRQKDRQTTDDRWSEKLTWDISSGELKTETKSSPMKGCVCQKWFFDPVALEKMWIVPKCLKDVVGQDVTRMSWYSPLSTFSGHSVRHCQRFEEKKRNIRNS